MSDFAHQAFNRMFVPTVLVGLWAYAHFESIRARTAITTWKEGNAVVVGNPYTRPLPVRQFNPLDPYDDGGDIEVDQVATTGGDS